MILEARLIRNRINFENVLYFGWPNQPSSDTMRIYIGDVFKYGERDTCVIKEIRKVSEHRRTIDNPNRGSGWGGRGGTNVSRQLKIWPFVSCQLNFGPFISCQ